MPPPGYEPYDDRHLPYRWRVPTANEHAVSAWSLLSLTSTAHGVLTYPDELEVRYVYDNTVPNGRHVKVGDLAVIRDDQCVLAAGWIDSIEETSGRKIRYRCPNCTSTDFKYRTKKQFAYRCATCTTEFDTPRKKSSPSRSSRRTTPGRLAWSTERFPSRPSIPPTLLGLSRTPSDP